MTGTPASPRSATRRTPLRGAWTRRTEFWMSLTTSLPSPLTSGPRSWRGSSGSVPTSTRRSSALIGRAGRPAGTATRSLRLTGMRFSRSAAGGTRRPRCGGASPISGTDSGARPPGCGFPRPPWTARRSKCSSTRESNSPFWRLVRQRACASPAVGGGRGRRRWTRAGRIGARWDTAGSWRSSSTTGRSLTRSPSTGSSGPGTRWRRVSWPASTGVRAPTHPRRDGRGELRPSPSLRGDGSGGSMRPDPGERHRHPHHHAAFLAAHPPTTEVRVVDGSSWSCAHGVERWRADCGCRAGRHPGWTQRWRAPLREALDWLRDAVDPLYEARAATLVRILGPPATRTSM